MQKISPFLWFDDQAEHAIKFYVSNFKNSDVGDITRCGDAGPGPKGSVTTASFELEGQQFTASTPLRSHKQSWKECFR